MKISIVQFKVEEMRYDDDLDLWCIELIPFESVCNNNLLNLLVWNEGLKNGIRVEHFADLTAGLIANSESIWDYQPMVSGVRYDFHYEEVSFHAINLFGITNVIIELTPDKEWLRMYHLQGNNEKEHLVGNWKIFSESVLVKDTINQLNIKILDKRNSYPNLFDRRKAIPIY